MSQIILSFLIVGVLTSSNVNSAQIKVIYGDDNRVDVIDSQNSLFQNLSESTAAMVKNENLIEHNSLQYELSGKSLEDRGICSSERFAKQPTTASCSGFLVSKDIIVTAGHCVQSKLDCETRSWVFNYKVQRDDDPSVIVDKTDVYKCSKIISQKLEHDTEVDYAVIKLKRAVTDKIPLKFRTKGSPQVGDPLVVIGHPSGLPTKISDGANVRASNSVYLTANSDTYGGNSGSAVFNATTGIVEGILVRGETDYIQDEEQGCKVSNVLADDKGDGEEVTLITIVEGLPKVTSPKPPKPPKPEPPVVNNPEEKPSQSLISRIRRFLQRLFS